MIEKGQKISERYEIIKSIGEGGMANVYLAKDVILDRKVAIKVLRGELAVDEKFIRRFNREAVSASQLAHPNIVEIYDVGEDGDIHYIVMEYIEGKTLKQLLKRRGKLTILEAVDIMLQLTDGIAHAHKSYIIHRDLKPQNIMIEDSGHIKITDFGIAMALNASHLTQTNSVMGSVHYLPPEQASGKASTTRCDIYSMGIMFYELLTGILPFKGENAVEIALKHMKDPLPNVRKQNNSIPQSIENIVLKATAKNPKNRYSDIKEMHKALEEALDEEQQDVDKVVFKYPETDLDNTNIDLPTIKKENKEKPVVKEVKKEVPRKKKNNWLILSLSAVFVLLVVALLFIFLPPILDNNKEIKIPDVSGMTIEAAIEVLNNAGLEVEEETSKMISNEFEEGTVIKTDPLANRTIKKTRKIIIWESLGVDSFELEDYKGQNYIEVKTKLETAHGIIVEIEKEKVEKWDDKQGILSQNPAPGTLVKEGDRVTLFVPDVYEKYPDFIKESWTIEEIKDFAENYDLKLNINYSDTTNYEDGAIIAQSKKAKSEITKWETLVITIAKTPVAEEENPGEPSDNDGT